MDDNKIIKREYIEVDMKLINNDHNVRTEEQLRNIEELKTSIKRVGLIHPIIVEEENGRFNLLAGQRRVLAFQQLGYDNIPAIKVNGLNDIAKKIVSLTENLHRRSLSFGDTVAVCDTLFKTYTGPTNQRIKKIATEIGVSIGTIMKYMAYRLIPKKVQNMVIEGKLTRSQAFKITQAFWPNSKKIEKIAQKTYLVPKQTWERALDIGKKKPNFTVDEIMKEALSTKYKYKISLQLDSDNFKYLNSEAEKRTKSLDREISVEDIITELIDKFISHGG